MNKSSNTSGISRRQCLRHYLVALILALSACTGARAEPSGTPTSLPTLTVRRISIVRTIPAAAPPATPGAPPKSVVCPLPDLVPGQHIAASGSYTETETAAAGPMVCRIERDSCAYRHLIGNLDPTIAFKREEEPPYDREDILMHPAMLLPLTRLNELVVAEWGSAVQLRVTDAYDSLLEHDLAQSDESRKSTPFILKGVPLT